MFYIISWPIPVEVLVRLKDPMTIFAITAAGVVSCGGPKQSHRTPSIVLHSADYIFLLVL